MPGEGRAELTKPEGVVEPLVDLCDPAFTLNGQVIGR